MKVLVSHPTGNTFVRALVNCLSKYEQLKAFYTTINWCSDSWIGKALPSRLVNQLERRSFSLINGEIRTRPLRESVRLIAGRLNLPVLKSPGKGWACLDAVYRDLDRYVSRCLHKEKPTHVHCYEDGALESFKVANELGVYCSYELPIAYWRKLHQLLDAEAEKRPEWASTLVYGDDSAEKLERKESELSLSDLVVVPSSFVRDSLPEGILNTKHVVVSPFGTPQAMRISGFETPPPRPLRFLFAGSMGQRKGLADVLEAFAKADRKDIELVILGSPMLSMDFYRGMYSGFIYEKPRAHAEVLSLMQSCHVLILPSIVEGRALVQQEAMSQKMALLVTPNAGGDDLVIEDVTGRLVPPGHPELLLEAIHKFADNPFQTLAMGKEASNHAKKYTWDSYAQTIANALSNLER